MVKNPGTKKRVQRTLGDCFYGKPMGFFLKETIAVSVTLSISVSKIDTADSVSEFFHAAE